jgi:hypothetical protein
MKTAPSCSDISLDLMDGAVRVRAKVSAFAKRRSGDRTKIGDDEATNAGQSAAAEILKTQACTTVGAR